MNILFLSHTLQPTGAPRVLLNLVEWLHENTEHEMEFLSVEGGALKSAFGRCGRVHLLSRDWIGSRKSAWSEGLKKLFSAVQGRVVLRRLRSRIGNDKTNRPIDLVYANTITLGNVLEWLRLDSTPVLTHVHELESVIGQFGEDNLTLVKKHTRHYFAASRAVKEQLVQSQMIPAAKVSVVHEFIRFADSIAPRKRLRAELNIPADAYVVIGAGIGTWRKGIDLFVDVAAQMRLRAPGSDILFVWLGGWDTPESQTTITDQVREKGLDGVMRFEGHVDNPLDYFAAADVFALTSREDPYPLVCLEAASAGIPVVCFEKAGGMPEFVEHDAGGVVSYLNVAAMADALNLLRCDLPLRSEFGQRAAEKVRQRHGVDRAASFLREKIESIA